MARFVRNRLWLLGSGALLALACGCGDVGNDATLGGSDISALEEGAVRGSLGTDGDNLIVTLRNDTDEDAKVSLNVFIQTPVVNSKTDAGVVTVPARTTLRQVLPSEELEGFDTATNQWLRAELHYEFELDSGLKSRRLTGMATRSGAVVPHEEAADLGLVIHDTVLDNPEFVRASPSATGTFKICFTNNLTFATSTGFTNDGLTPDLTPDNVHVPMPGQFFYAYYPTTATTPTTTGTLDSSGCSQPITKQTSGSETWKFRPILYAFTSPWGIVALDNTGVTPGIDRNVTVPSTGNPATQDILMTNTAGGDQQKLQAGLFLSNNTTLRAGTIGVTPGASILMVSTTTADDTSHYCPGVDAANDCPSARTLRLTTARANNRDTVAHETGHWIHHQNIGNPFWHDYSYSSTDAAPLSPTESAACPTRRTVTGHSSGSIEWQSAAHLEGLAEFFTALSYNKTTQKDCTVRGNSCESAGRTLSACTEWVSSRFFDTGNELDWTKMYWDFVTDKGGSMNSYLAAENAVADGAWPSDGKGNHVDLIWAQMGSDQRRRLNDSAGGNIWDGTADFVCNSSTGIVNGDICCLKSCGTCGGSGCSGRPGGSSGCCTGTIRANDRTCAPNVAPCIIR